MGKDFALLIAAAVVIVVVALRIAERQKYIRKKITMLDVDIARTDGERREHLLHRRKRLQRSVWYFWRPLHH